jgi:hypothetical protein
MIDTPTRALDKLFREHPRDIGESYGEHAGHALFIGSRMLLAGCACVVHALLPGLFERTASNTVDRILALMAERTAEDTDSERLLPASPTGSAIS